MESWLQHLLLKPVRLKALPLFAICMGAPSVALAAKIDTEFFELGVTAGMVTIEDFTTEFSYGVSGTFKTTEDFFLQFNGLTSDFTLSSVEESAQGPYSGDRTYRHWNLLLGYNVFQGEVFRGDYAGLASLYVVGGVGDTEFLDESNFTYVYGVGYHMAVSRRYTVRLDYRQTVYDSAVVDQQENTTTNAQLSIGFGWLF